MHSSISKTPEPTCLLFATQALQVSMHEGNKVLAETKICVLTPYSADSTVAGDELKLLLTETCDCHAQAELSALEAELEACIAGDDAPAEAEPPQPEPATDWAAARHHSLTPAPKKASAGARTMACCAPFLSRCCLGGSGVCFRLGIASGFSRAALQCIMSYCDTLGATSQHPHVLQRMFSGAGPSTNSGRSGRCCACLQP
jgi:hypothetical protein